MTKCDVSSWSFTHDCPEWFLLCCVAAAVLPQAFCLHKLSKTSVWKTLLENLSFSSLQRWRVWEVLSLHPICPLAGRHPAIISWQMTISSCGETTQASFLPGAWDYSLAPMPAATEWNKAQQLTSFILLNKMTTCKLPTGSGSGNGLALKSSCSQTVPGNCSVEH